MKNKFLNLNILLLLFLCLIGFSPQSNSLFSMNTVYALENVDSILTNTDKNGNITSGIANDKFQTQIDGLIDGLNSSKADYLKDNISESISLMTKTMSNISTAASGFALTLSVVIIVIIGFKVIKSGTGDVLTFMKQKKDISNAIVCIIFILAIPYFVRSVLEFKPPEILFSSVDSSISGNTNIGDIISTPKSGLKEYITANQDDFTQDNGDRFNVEDFWGGDGFKDAGSIGTGIVKMLWSALLAIFAGILYAPFLLITSYIGSISFFPVSFDATMYLTGGGSVAEIAKSFFNTSSQSAIAGIGTNIIDNVAKGLADLTGILNILYFLIKKFVMLCLEFVCYYFGIMHLLNKDTDDVGKFLVRLAQGVIGITLFPYLIEFLLDVDGIIATAILRITGPALPGFSIMSILPTVEQAKTGFTVLVLSIIMCSLVFSLAKSFFIRRIEVSLLYVSSPIFFLKHMMSSNDGSIKVLTSKITSAIFLTTAYAPVLAIVNLMLSFGIASSDVGMIYFMLVIGVLWLGKGVIVDIIRKLTGESASISSAGSQFERGVSRVTNTVEKGAKFGAGALAFGATTAALNNAGSIKNGIKNAPKTLTNAETWKKARKTLTSKDSWGNGAKTLGSGVMKTGKQALNIGKNQFWEKYNKAEKRYGKFNATEAETNAIRNKMDFDYKKFDRKDELDNAKALNNLYKSDKPEDIANFKKHTNFYQNHKRLKEGHVDFLDKAKQSKDKIAEMTKKSGNADIQKSFDEYDKVYNSTNSLMIKRDKLLDKGDIRSAYDVEMEIQGNKEFMKRYQDSIHYACNSNESLQKKAKGLVPLRVLSSNLKSIQPQAVRLTNDANTIVASMNSIKELDTFKGNSTAEAEINGIIELANKGNFEEAQSSIQNLIVSQSANFTTEDRAKLDSHVSKMFNFDITPEQHAASVVNLPKVQFKAGEVKSSMEKLKHINAFKNNKESMEQIDNIIKLTDSSSVDDIRTAVNSFVATQLSSNNFSVNDAHAFKNAFKGVYNGNMADVQKHAIDIVKSSKQLGDQYHSQVSALASGENADILDYIAVSSGLNKDKHQASIKTTYDNNISEIQEAMLKQHVSIVKQGVNEDSTIKDSEYGKVIKGINSDFANITDFIVMSSGQNEAHYNSVAKSMANNICESGFNTGISSILKEELKTKFNPESTSDFSFGNLNECIGKAGGAEQLKNAYISSNNVYIKSSETTRERIVNIPKAANYNVTIEPNNTNGSNNNDNNSGGKKRDDSTHEGNDKK